MLTIDPSLFHPDSISAETQALNAWIRAEIAKGKDAWTMPPAQVRARRASGRGIFPVQPENPDAYDISVPGGDGPITARIFKPKTGDAKGSYLHIHGGGWQVGSIYGQDERLQELSDRSQLNCICIDYRLAPEHPYPAAPDDCEAAAHWLMDADHAFNRDFLAIGGESAGAHLCVLTLLRLRENPPSCSFDATVLTCGVYDLGQTASSKNWGPDKLVLNSRDMQFFANGFLQSGEDKRSAMISPLFASLEGMPPAYFTVGTQDLLLDDTLQMATRWHAVNGSAELEIVPGGCHVFQNFRHIEISKTNNKNVDAFLVRQLQDKSET